MSKSTFSIFSKKLIASELSWLTMEDLVIQQRIIDMSRRFHGDVMFDGQSRVNPYLRGIPKSPTVFKVKAKTIELAKQFYSALMKETPNATCDQDYPAVEIEIPPTGGGRPIYMDPITIGIMGGMGPEATLMLLDKLQIRHYDSRIIVLMLTQTPDRTGAILGGDVSNQDKIEALFKGGSQFLTEDRKVSTVLVPCNTAHKFSSSVQGITNMIQVTLEDLAKAAAIKSEQHRLLSEQGDQKKHKLKVISFATQGTNTLNLYDPAGQGVDDHLTIITPEPDSEEQKQMMAIIYDNVKKHGVTQKAIDLFTDLVLRYVDEHYDGSTKLAIGLFCTEFPLIVNHPDFRPEKIPANKHDPEGKTLEDVVDFIDPMSLSGRRVTKALDPMDHEVMVRIPLLPPHNYQFKGRTQYGSARLRNSHSHHRV